MQIIIFFSCFALMGNALAQTASIQATMITHSDPEIIGLSWDEAKEGKDVHTPLWQTHQCCLQKKHRLGLRSDYCLTEEMIEKIETTKACEVLK